MSTQLTAQQLIDDGDITPIEAANRLSVVEALAKSLKAEQTALRGYLAEHLDPKEHLTGVAGDITYKRGAASKFKVVDPQAYAQWLLDNGEEESVEQVIQPKDFATKPDVLEAALHSNHGEAVPGIGETNGTSDSVAVKLRRDWREALTDPVAVTQVQQVLGIESSPEETTEETGEDPWARN